MILSWHQSTPACVSRDSVVAGAGELVARRCGMGCRLRGEFVITIREEKKSSGRRKGRQWAADGAKQGQFSRIPPWISVSGQVNYSLENMSLSCWHEESRPW